MTVSVICLFDARLARRLEPRARCTFARITQPSPANIGPPASGATGQRVTHPTWSPAGILGWITRHPRVGPPGLGATSALAALDPGTATQPWALRGMVCHGVPNIIFGAA